MDYILKTVKIINRITVTDLLKFIHYKACIKDK